jgi:uncharacterized repeat protein (TIGR01451 family)
MSRVVETSATACALVDKQNTTRRLGARAILPGLGRVGVFALLLLLATFGSHAAQAQTLVITKAVNNPTPNVGDTIIFTVGLSNPGSGDVTNVQVTDALPAGLTLVNSSPSQGTYASGLWMVGTVAGGASATLTLLVTVASPNPQTNTATITAATPNTSVGNSASATETPQQADLQLAKTVSTAAPNVGDTITFTVTLTNAGPDAATNVTVADTLPVGLTLLNSSPSQGTYAGGIWTVGSVAFNASATLTLQATVISPNSQTNTASVSHSDQFDPNTANNTASATETPQQADLQLTKTAPASAAVGTTFNYTITLSNLGPNTATNVTAQDVLPAGVTLVNTTATQGSYNSGTSTWTVGSIAASASATLTVTVQKSAATSVTNTASVSHSDQFDPNTGNNSASVTTQTATQSPPTISKSFGVSSIPVGGTTSLSFTIANPNGGATLTGVGFTDNLPAGLVVATPNGLSGSCGSGTISAIAGSGGISLSGATIAANSVCTLQVNVTGTTAGVKNNTTSAVTSIEGGNGNIASATLTVMSGATNTSTTLVSSLNPSIVGQLVTFTATVTPTGGTGTPTGTVTFADGATTLGTVTLSGTTAAFSTSSLVAGNHTITASYSGDTNFSASASPALVQTVNQPAATNTALASSVNPSNLGQAVTFTATVTSTAGTPTGTVSFKDGGTVIGTGALSAGVAAFTTSSLTLGAHTITASYSGTTSFAASTSPALTQTVLIPPDSVRLRALQVAVSRVEAQASGSAFEGAVAGAIADGFAEGGELMKPSANGVRFNFAADPDASVSSGRVAEQYDSVSAARVDALRDSGLSAMNQNVPANVRSYVPDPSAGSGRVNNAFAALADARPIPTKAPALFAAPKEWFLWADVRGTGWNTDQSAGDIRGGQINAIAGLTRKLTPDFLLGVLGGYENFDYTSQTFNGRLKGDGWTVGGYLGWRVWPGVRFDAAVGRSGVSYDGVSGTAVASFPANRWLASAGLTGTYRLPWLEIEPSAKVYAIWERDYSYIDSLGTLQAENTFSTGRASTGVKVAYPIYWGTAAVAPYVGIYADYYFSSENAVLLLPTTFVQGWAARTTVGVSYNIAGGAKVLVGGEVGGLGSQNFTVWSVRGRASVPF